MKTTGAVLVAAGLSSRMHTFKPLLPLGNTTIAGHVVGMMNLLGIDPVVVVTGYRGEELERHLSCFSPCFVRNERYRQTEMFDSVKMGIQAASGSCSRILMMPMDIPSVCLDTFNNILKTEGKIVRVSYHGKPGHPVLMETETALELCSYQGTDGFRGAIRASGIPETVIEVQDEGICWDVDTEEEYQRLIQTFTWNGNEKSDYLPECWM